MTFLDTQLDQVRIGDDAGWRLTFHKRGSDGTPLAAVHREFSSRDYSASIEATLAEGLAGGAFKFVVEGMLPDDHAAIRIKEGQPPLAAKLYLFWRDVNTGVGSYLKNVVGINAGPTADDADKALVAVLAVTQVKRQLGSRQEETEIVAVDDAFARLTAKLKEPITGKDFREALGKVATATGLTIEVHPASGPLTKTVGESPGDEQVTFGKGLLYRTAVERTANAIEQSLNKFGRKMALLRDGVVHVGERPIPLDGGPAKHLELGTGLIETAEKGTDDGDPSEPMFGEAPKKKPTVYTLTLKGRGDLKPGDVVTFAKPHPDEPALPGVLGAIAGAFAAPFVPTLSAAADATAYVTSVKHTLSRTKGWVTEMSAVTIKGAGADAWDARKDEDSNPTGKQDGKSTSADAKTQAAETVKRFVRSQQGETKLFEVGEVREFNSRTAGGVEPPSQTETVWEGLKPPDGKANGARRLAIADKPAPLRGVAYATLFAWGQTGLVVPRYPGTRVVLGYRNGQLEDPIDLGALWQSGKGPASEPGDWWLSLPVGVSESKRSSLGDGDKAQAHEGRVSNDLIDASGNRVIEVGQFTVRVGTSKLANAGTRPALGDADTVTIEQADSGSKIVMKKDGSIVISGKSITFKADETIALEAVKVDVKVSDAMEVT